MTPYFFPIVTDNKKTDFHVHFTSREETEELVELLNRRQYFGAPEKVIKEKDGYFYLDPTHSRENIVLDPTEVEQLLPDQELKSSDLSDDFVFQQEIKKLENAQKKIDKYIKNYYRIFYNNDDLTDDKEKLQHLAGVVKKEYVSHGFLKKFERKKIPLINSLSFQDIMVERSAMRKLGHQDYAWELDRKTKAYQFADEIGLRRPEADDQIYTFEEIKGRKGPVVIKPVQSTGSTGVYLIFDDETILSAEHSHYLTSWNEIEAEMKEPLAAVHHGRPYGSLRKDEWIAEELILRDPASTAPPLDYKFYCFYGELLFVLEADRADNSGFSVWNADGKLADTGWQSEKLREGIGFSREDADEALRASLEVPSPFIRMDMLKSHDGIVFGEATPRPGRFHLFNEKYDRLMGKAYREAEARLQRDLLNGKEFNAFKKHFQIR
jgi:hypothetical protein